MKVSRNGLGGDVLERDFEDNFTSRSPKNHRCDPMSAFVWPKIRTTNFLYAGSCIGARFDGTLQICVSDGTSMRFRTSEYDLCPLQERVLDNRREGGAEQVMC